MLDGDRYCPRCRAALVAKDVQGTLRPACPQCGKVLYYDPKLATAVVIEREGRVLMVRRATEPGLGLWSLPGGYVDRGEVVEAAAAREVLEETGLEVSIQGLVGLFSEPGHPVILAAYKGRVVGGEPVPGPEVTALDFFYTDHLPPLAFPRDRDVLAAWTRMRRQPRGVSGGDTGPNL